MRAPSQNPLMQTRNCKILAHDAVDCDASLWIDANVEVQSLEQSLFNACQPTSLCAVIRNEVTEEAAYCKAARRGDPSLIDGSIAQYGKSCIPLIMVYGIPPSYSITDDATKS